MTIRKDSRPEQKRVELRVHHKDEGSVVVGSLADEDVGVHNAKSRIEPVMNVASG